MSRIINPMAINNIRIHAESTGLDEEAVVLVQGASRAGNDNRLEWEREYSYLRIAPKGSGDRPSVYGVCLNAREFENGKAPKPGYYWVDVDGTLVDKSEEFGEPDHNVDHWAGIWQF